MTLINRSLISLKRNKISTLVIFSLVFLLCLIFLASITARKSIKSTEENMWQNLPAYVIIDIDNVGIERYWRKYGIWDPPVITLDLINEINDLSYVQSVHISKRGNTQILNTERYWEGIESPDPGSLKQIGIFEYESFEMRGAATSNFAELDLGIIKIIDGDTFSTYQIEQSLPVAIISQQVAKINNLQIGSTLTVKLFDRFTEIKIDDYGMTELKNIYKYIDIEIIGIFELIGSLNEFSSVRGNGFSIGGVGESIEAKLNVINTIFMPFEKVDNLEIDIFFAYEYAYIEFVRTYYPEFYKEYFYGREIYPPNETSIDNFIILNDPRDIPAFYETVSKMLPDFLMIRNVTNSFENVLVSMYNINQVSSFILFITIGASFLILIFLMILLLNVRRHEIGVYLALGEKKKNLILQNLLEFLIIGISAIILALIINNFITLQISNNLVANEMNNIRIDRPSTTISNELGFFTREVNLLDWFVPDVQEIYSLIEVFDISLSSFEVINFLVGAMSVIIISVFIATIHIIRITPFKILLKSKIM